MFSPGSNVIPPENWFKGDGGIRWFNQFNTKPKAKRNPSFVTRTQRVKARLIASSGVYVQKNEPSGKTYTPQSFFYEPQTPYERETPLNVTSDELIRYYFNALESGQHAAEYGDDVNATAFSEGTKWGFDELPECLLNRANKGGDSKGITTPYLCFGFGGSSFPMHVEYQRLNSGSFLHRGGNKIWFFLPVEYAEQLSKFFVEDFEKCEHHLRHKDKIVDPELLREAGIPVFEAVQAEAEFIFTFPNGLHFGHNQRRNWAEAINFATLGWIICGLACEKGKCQEDNACRTNIPVIEADKIAQEHSPDCTQSI